jgi:3-dehydroquinate dehydratase-1
MEMITNDDTLHQKIPRAAIVGIIDSPQALAASNDLAPGMVDFLEWRADHLGTDLPKRSLPWIVTVRHPDEGGNADADADARREVFHALLPAAAMIDLEISTWPELADVAETARSEGISRIASFHDFEKTPSFTFLCDLVQRAVDLGADIVKIATRTDGPGDVARLLGLLERSPLPAAVMGMGRLGMPSRLMLASAGSCLNYGWLYQPNVTGQWSASELRSLLRRTAPGVC